MKSFIPTLVLANEIMRVIEKGSLIIAIIIIKVIDTEDSILQVFLKDRSHVLRVSF